MFLQQTTSNVISAIGMAKVPIGTGLNGGTPSLPLIDGTIAVNATNNQLYYVGGNSWKAATGDLVTLAAVGAAPNVNGASIVGQVLNLQPASGSFPGVVNTLAQAFSGVKTFNNGIIADGTNYIAANPTAGTAANDGILINNPANTINLEFADDTHNGIVSTVAQNFNGVKGFSQGLIAGPLVPSVPGFDNVLINYGWYNMSTVNLSGGITGSFVIRAQRVGNFVTLLLSSHTIPISGAGLATVTTALPVEFRPLAFPRGGAMPILVFAVYGLGGFEVSTAGVLTIGAGWDGLLNLIPFAVGAGATGWPDCTITYAIN